MCKSVFAYSTPASFPRRLHISIIIRWRRSTHCRTTLPLLTTAEIRWLQIFFGLVKTDVRWRKERCRCFSNWLQTARITQTTITITSSSPSARGSMPVGAGSLLHHFMSDASVLAVLADLLWTTPRYHLPTLCVGILSLFPSIIPKTSIFNFVSSDIRYTCQKSCNFLSNASRTGIDQWNHSTPRPVSS